MNFRGVIKYFPSSNGNDYSYFDSELPKLDLCKELKIKIMEDSELQLKTILTEKEVEEPIAIEYQSLLSEDELKDLEKEGPERLQVSSSNACMCIRNVVTGIARFNFQGHRWHNFRFDIPVGITPVRAVVSLGLLNIYNRNSANMLQYYIPNYSVSYLPGIVRVTGSVFVGDSDGYLHGLGYVCACR